LPTLLYGTAWKEDATQRLVELALEQGFRGIDTANQRKHYYEAAVGRAVKAAIERKLVTRDQIFLQTKFTFARGQDHRLPYDPNAPIADQVQQSFASSLEHLGVSEIDSYLLHGPWQRGGLTRQDWDAWWSMEAIEKNGRARVLGVSNFSLVQLQELCHGANTKPHFVQNRCYASEGWDRAIRGFCADQGITYQGFSLLTANAQALARSEVVQIARRHGKTIAQIVFRFAQQIGLLPLTGTTSASHMREDLEAERIQLDAGEIDRIERLASSP
jgi:diketogulonate reductase-like aldo/keto reductase